MAGFTASSRFIDALATSTADLRNYVYQIGLDNDQNVVLERMLADGASPPGYTVDISRVLLRRRPQERISDFGFTLVRSNLLVLTFSLATDTKSSANQAMTLNENFRATFNLPTKSL